MKRIIKWLFVKEIKEEAPARSFKKNGWEVSRDQYNKIHGLGDTLI